MVGGHAVGTMLPGQKQSTSVDDDSRLEEAHGLAAAMTNTLTDVQRRTTAWRTSYGDEEARRGTSKATDHRRPAAATKKIPLPSI